MPIRLILSDEAHGPDRRRQLLRETLAILRSISPQDKEKLALQPLLELRGEEAQDRVNILQTIADSPQLLERDRFLTLKTIFRLSQASQQYPQCYVIKNLVRGKRIGRGSFGKVYEGKIAVGDQSQTRFGPNRIDYAVKVVEFFPGVIGIDDCIREAVLWRQFRHPNVLPFLGMYYQGDNREDVCFVSPYMNNGSLSAMLQRDTWKPSQEDMCILVHDIASGLEYLHGENVIHGDLKPDNVLITDHSRACLCDFGQSRVASTKGFQPTEHKGGGTAGYMAPEVMEGSGTSKKSDVYSFGCLCNKILQKTDNLSDLKGPMSDMITKCMARKPDDRPAAKKLITLLNGMSSDPEPAPDWDDTEPLFIQVRSNVDHGDMSLQLLSPVPANQTSPTSLDRIAEDLSLSRLSLDGSSEAAAANSSRRRAGPLDQTELEESSDEWEWA